MMKHIILPILYLLLSTTTSSAIMGINYGRVANNLPQPSKVANFLTSKTTLKHVKIFDFDPQILQGFANTNISLTITIPNANIPQLTNPSLAQSWIATNIIPYYPKTIIRYIIMGNEVQFSGDQTLMNNTIKAMNSIYQALLSKNLTKIKVTTPHSLAILERSKYPSFARFKMGYEKVFFIPLLEFHRKTKSPFMVNPYPYFGFDPNNVNFATFKENDGLLDKSTGLRYYNMFDYLMDAVYSSMKRLGYDDVEINVGETGWPSLGDPSEPFATLENAVSYNSNLIKHVSSGNGTPLMPNRTLETYIFALFNENLKSSTSERNYGLFRPDFTPVYDVGVFNP
ncbi:glucan endo-1,3-beta-glucosidase-like [Amaranthus tricolor]|uniref:glucan endo-1,3-beta-glucosidase-like n=1 Tax=Amaranthus tricolor TaxID=29722 RepID=UPI00258FA2F6|nr:glucan endo-1,3-beta-glucosidase-like [Amaranthus tricolor]